MLNYIIRRLLLMIPTFLGVTVLVYLLLCWAPGGPVETRMAAMEAEGAKKGNTKGGLNGEAIRPLISLDLDKDNTLSKSEMKESKGAFDAMDADKDGALSAIEFNHAKSQLISAAKEQMLAEMRKFYGFAEPSFKEYRNWLFGLAGLEFKGIKDTNAPQWPLAWRGHCKWIGFHLPPDEQTTALAQADTDLQEALALAGQDTKLTEKATKAHARAVAEIKGMRWPIDLSLGINLGYSLRYNQPVADVIFDKERLTIGCFFGLSSILIAYFICIPFGIYKARHHGKMRDSTSSAMMFAAYSIPGWVLGTVLLLVFASKLGWFPIDGFVSKGHDEMSLGGRILDLTQHMALPLAAYVAGSFASMTFLMKNSLMDNLSTDYVRTALAKGNTFNAALWKHAFRNSIIPIASGFGHNIALFVSGSYLIERVFNLNGFGQLSINSIEARDYPLVMGMLCVTTMLLLIGNLLSDLCVAIVDPRVKFD